MLYFNFSICLVEVAQPPASAVRKFLSLLEQSDLDFSEEIECQRLKSIVVQQIRSNQHLEQDLNVMDIKIGLLVKNRITLQVYPAIICIN